MISKDLQKLFNPWEGRAQTNTAKFKNPNKQNHKTSDHVFKERSKD